MTLKEIVEALENEGFIGDSGHLKNHVAFQELRRKAKDNRFAITVDVRGMDWVQEKLDEIRTYFENELQKLKDTERSDAH